MTNRTNTTAHEFVPLHFGLNTVKDNCGFIVSRSPNSTDVCYCWLPRDAPIHRPGSDTPACNCGATRHMRSDDTHDTRCPLYDDDLPPALQDVPPDRVWTHAGCGEYHLTPDDEGSVEYVLASTAEGLAEALREAQTIIPFLKSQIVVLANRAFSEGIEDWLAHCDAYNAGNRLEKQIDTALAKWEGKG